MTTAEKIRFLRIRGGMTQEELGKKIGVQRAAINKYEKGTVVNIKKSVLEKLATALGVSPADLLDDSSGIYIDGDNGAFLESELSSIEDELINKIKKLSPSYQRIVLSLVDQMLEEEGEQQWQ